jgi:hypothetical protein
MGARQLRPFLLDLGQICLKWNCLIKVSVHHRVDI